MQKLKDFIKNIRIKNIASAKDIKELSSLANYELSKIVEEKRAIINSIVENGNEYSGFYQMDVKVPWDIKIHRFESAVTKYKNAAKSFDVYGILVNELEDFSEIVEQVKAIKEDNIESLNSKYPLEEKINNNIVKVADMLEASVLPTLQEMCLKCSQRIKWVKYEDLLKAELARIRSAAYSKLFELDPIKIENIKLKSGRDGVEGSWYITESNDSCWKFEFTAILAGGYYVQCLHTRTISKLNKLR